MVSQMETSLGEDKDNDLSDEIVVGHLNLHIPKKGKESCIWPNFKCVWWKRNWHQHFSHQSGRLVASFEIRFIPSRQHFSITRSPHCLATYRASLIFSCIFLPQRGFRSNGQDGKSSRCGCRLILFFSLKWKKRTAGTFPLWDIRVMTFNPGNW